jgi:hypothetical protein
LQAVLSLLPPTLLAVPSTHLLIEVLRRPLEFTQCARQVVGGAFAEIGQVGTAGVADEQ